MCEFLREGLRRTVLDDPRSSSSPVSNSRYRLPPVFVPGRLGPAFLRLPIPFSLQAAVVLAVQVPRDDVTTFVFAGVAKRRPRRIQEKNNSKRRSKGAQRVRSLALNFLSMLAWMNLRRGNHMNSLLTYTSPLNSASSKYSLLPACSLPPSEALATERTVSFSILSPLPLLSPRNPGKVGTGTSR